LREDQKYRKNFISDGEKVGQIMQKFRNIHVLLFAIFPVLFLFSHNVGLVSLTQILIPIVIVVVFALLLWSVLRLIVKDETKAGIFVSLFMLLLFAYGHLFSQLTNVSVRGVDIGQHKYVFPIWGILVLICGAFFLTTRRDLRKFADVLNVVAIALVAMTAANAVYGSVGRTTTSVEAKAENKTDLEASDLQPDIYYIVLDACARADILEEIYQVDVTEFNQSLTEKGFFVANQSRANYSQTQLALASALNFTYLDELANQVGVESSSRLPLRNMIHHSRLVDLLKQRGYLFVAFATGMDNTEIKGADRYITSRWSLSEFHNGLLNSTPIPGLLNRLLSKSSDFQHNSHIDRVLYTFEHPPFVFGENGEQMIPDRDFGYNDGNFFQGGSDEYIAGYGRQVVFINKKIEETVEAILSNSPDPPIIILQADHGAGSSLDFYSLENTNLRE
jgi:FtsH-binding integral membrane protein